MAQGAAGLPIKTHRPTPGPRTPTPIVEKTNLFWHGHLTSSPNEKFTRELMELFKLSKALAGGAA